jgi:GTP1/Obg family GTP-binding protein
MARIVSVIEILVDDIERLTEAVDNIKALPSSKNKMGSFNNRP